MSNDITPPLVVTDSTMEGQIATLVRYLLTSVGGYALGKGWIDNDALVVLTGLVTVAAPTAYGIFKTYTSKKRLIAVAEAAPDATAVVVSA